MNNIKEKLEKINSDNINNTIIVLIILFVGFISFGLGRLSALSEKKSPITVEGQSQTSNIIKSKTSIPGVDVNGERLYVASKKGTKYHYPWCGGAQRIKEANKIYFDTKEEAEAAGYSPAGNCKGL